MNDILDQCLDELSPNFCLVVHYTKYKEYPFVCPEYEIQWNNITYTHASIMATQLNSSVKNIIGHKSTQRWFVAHMKDPFTPYELG